MQRLGVWDCTRKSFHIPDGVEYIGMLDFAGLDTLEELFIPKSLKRIEKSTFEGCENLQITVDPENPWFCSEDGALYNKAKTILYRGPGRCAFFVVPESVRVLHDDALSELPDLKNLTLPTKLREIRDCALTYFAGEELVLPETVETIGTYALAWSKLKHLRLPESLREIKKSAFLSCEELTSIRIPKRVEAIGTSAFQGIQVSSLEVDPENPHFCAKNNALYNKEKTQLLFAATKKATFRIPSTVREIDAHAFTTDKYNMTTVWLNEGLESVGECAFYYSNAKIANFPSTLVHIGNEAFGGVRGPRKLVIPKAMTHIPKGAFDTCNILNTVKFHPSVTHIGKRAFRGCWMLKELNLPKGLVEIDDEAFNNCALKKVTFPNSLRRIGARAFQSCDLCEITLPPKLESIGAYAFYNEYATIDLERVIFTGPPIQNVGVSAFPSDALGLFPLTYASEWYAVIRKHRWHGLRMGFYSIKDGLMQTTFPFETK